MALVEIRNLTKVYPLGENIFGGGARGEIRAVDDVSLDIEAGETLGLVGESGSGKSTLGRLVLQLVEPTSGSVRFEGRDLVSLKSSDMRRLRRDTETKTTDAVVPLISGPSRQLHGTERANARACDR